MKPKISEFSYGYALTDDLVNGIGIPLDAAPVFPSLIKEGKENGGYDLALESGGVPLFLQFKLSEYMKNKRVMECKKYGLFSPPFYRMHLQPLRHSRQHSLLLDLEGKGNLVYYVAPTFHEIKEINQYYINREIVVRSIFVRPSAIGELPDNNAHHVAFKVQETNLPLSVSAYLLSQPVLLEIDVARSLTDAITAGLHHREPYHKTPAELYAEILSGMIGILEKRLDLADRSQLPQMDHGDSLRGVAYLARMYFACELFLVRPHPANA